MTIFQINVNLENNGKKAEIRVAAFVAESNLSFNVMDHLSQEITASRLIFASPKSAKDIPIIQCGIK
jgi:hypothetical protein